MSVCIHGGGSQTDRKETGLSKKEASKLRGAEPMNVKGLFVSHSALL